MVDIFGFVNATVTKIYVAANQTFDIYGSVSLTTPINTTYRFWYEEVSDEKREAGGDTYVRKARLIGNHQDDMDEGNFVTVQPDKVGSETQEPARNWRIENRKTPTGSTNANQRIRRIELDLIEEAS